MSESKDLCPRCGEPMKWHPALCEDEGHYYCPLPKSACAKIAEMKGQVERMSWQPIETAPKDGTEIDLWSPVIGRLENAKWGVKRQAWMDWGVDGFGGVGWCAVGYKVTHWMPLPNPPKDEVK